MRKLIVFVGALLMLAPAHEALAAPASFAQPAFYGATAPHGIDAGDLNGDGSVDIAATGTGASILLGNGAGGFGAASWIQALSGRSVEIVDLNRDGKPDLAAGTLNSPSVAVALGTGTGTFGPVGRFGPARADNDTGIASGDFNEDGIPDLAIPGAGNTVATVLGTGTGAFGAATSFPVGSLPNDVAVSDLNEDGHADLAVPNTNSNTVSVLAGTGTGAFGAPTHHPVGLSPRDVAIADFDGDGRSDLAVANSSSGTVSVLYVSATGLQPARHFAAGQAPSTVSVGDLNGDGRPDIVVASASNLVTQLAAAPSGGFDPPVHHQAGTAPADIAVADLNRDGRLDLAVANGGTQNVSIHINTTETTAPETTITAGPSELTNDPNPAFSFEADEPGTFACSLDQGTPSYAACASGDTFAVATDGRYTFRVRATDTVGNVDATPATRTFSVDTTPPETTITSGPSGETADPEPMFEFEADGPGTFACSLDQGTPSYAACASGDTFAVSTDGSYTFRVRATDGAGNTDPTPATREFILDTAPTPVFGFTGFFQPVDNLPTLNLTSPGQGVAIKFSLGGDAGLDVLADGYPKSEQGACDSSAEVDGVESTTAAGNNGLKYDPVTDTYTYVWKTERSWAGTCRQLVVRLTDGTSHRAAFKFRR